MSLKYLYPSVVAIGCALLCWVSGQNYWWSNFIVFLTYIIVVGIKVDWQIARSHWKGLLAFNLFCFTLSSLLELLFMYTDTWGFTRHFNEMIGIDILGCPIEEYIFWYFCPMAVSVSYLYTLGLRPVDTNRLLSSTNGYVDDVVVIDESGKPSYNRGVRIPIYSIFVVLIFATIALLSKYFSGRRKEILYTAIAFALLMGLYEQYALIHHVWSYNLNKMSGISFGGVPLEEWFVYIICPVSGCLFIRKFTDMLDKDSM